MNVSRWILKNWRILGLLAGLSIAPAALGAGAPATSRATPRDWIRAENGELTIHGRILLSLEEKYVFVQSNDSYFKIRRELVQGADAATLNQPGARVALHIPQRAIDYAWSASQEEPDGDKSERSLASRKKVR